ncbi:serine/threonine protein phosphatase [Fulvivirga sp. M361]|uniref:metallophosphoesterase n=1 Tax=Fulvivirga sp. M361 TaxID=2594266 RepID=UPI00117995F1|nr:metallophosphoesterase [Fulvivirga sp. M361]TRX50410.1 serine/threonine protein phosphatase [Fulvivirga sp. M361]
MRRYVIGDIHGGYKALLQCFERSGFDHNNDLLISLGDLCDGWSQTSEVLDELLSVKNLKLVLGNHDYYLLEWAKTGKASSNWLQNGGDTTLKSYGNQFPDAHFQLLESAFTYLKIDNAFFVHAGFEIGIPIDQQQADIFLWDRSLFREAITQYQAGVYEKLTPFDKVYIGHTPLHRYNIDKPILSGDVWLMDTGAGWEGGRLSMMDIDSSEVFASDQVDTLYPPGSGRQRY